MKCVRRINAACFHHLLSIQIHRDRKCNSGCQGPGEVGIGSALWRHRVSGSGDEEVVMVDAREGWMAIQAS